MSHTNNPPPPTHPRSVERRTHRRLRPLVGKQTVPQRTGDRLGDEISQGPATDAEDFANQVFEVSSGSPPPVARRCPTDVQLRRANRQPFFPCVAEEHEKRLDHLRQLTADRDRPARHPTFVVEPATDVGELLPNGTAFDARRRLLMVIP